MSQSDTFLLQEEPDAKRLLQLIAQDVRLGVEALRTRLRGVRSLESIPESKRGRYAEETLQVHTRIADRLCMHDVQEELEGLSLRFLEPDIFRRLSELREEIATTAEKTLQEVHEILQSSPDAPPCTPHHEAPSWMECRAMELTVQAESERDVAIVFVCETIENCYDMLGFLHRTWRHETLSFRDYINTPQINGYRGLHTTVLLRDGSRMHCRIRSPQMQTYAREGVAVVTTEHDILGIREYLPWLNYLPEAEADDILSTHILVHGSADKSFSVPQVASALDAAFFCFGKEALWTENIFINGRSVAFSAAIADGDCLHISSAGSRTVTATWLTHVRTGFARSLIANALSGQSRSQNIETGREMLQSLLRQHRKGFLEEYKEGGFTHAIHVLGFSSLDDIFIAIAEGRADVNMVYEKLFLSTKAPQSDRHVRWSIRGDLPGDAPTILTMLMQICRTYRADIQWVRWRARARGNRTGSVSIVAQLPKAEFSALVSELQTAGLTNIETFLTRSLFYYKLAAAGVIVLWGLDPVFSKVILRTLQVHPFHFSIFRAIGFLGLCALLLLWTRLRSPTSHQHLPWKDFPLWIAGAALTATSLGSYFSLEQLLPQEYITITFGSTILVPLLYASHRRALTKWPLIVGVSILLYTLFALAQFHEGSMRGATLVVAATTLIAFSVFTVCIDVYKRKHKISARMPTVLCTLAAIALMLHIPIAFFFSPPAYPPATIFLLMLYGIVQVGIPYILFYSVMTTDSLRWVAQYFFLATFLTLAAQYVVFGSLLLLPLLPLLCVALGAYMFHKQRFLYPETLPFA